MKVFGIGLQKTGTTTLGKCLRLLGLKHKSYSRKHLWSLRKNSIEDIQKVLDEYDSFEDEPWARCFRIADKLYPDAKFVLTLRKSPDAWYRSFCKHCDRIPYNEHRRYLFGCIMPRRHKDKMIHVYENHTKEVMEYFKGRDHKLLIVCWEDGEGWAPLCDGLNMPIPDTDFPHANQAPQAPVPHLTLTRLSLGYVTYWSKLLLARKVEKDIKKVLGR